MELSMSKLLLVMIAAVVCQTAIGHNEEPNGSILGRENLTGGLFGLNDLFEPSGIELTVSLTQIYQQNVRGGLSTHNRAGRYTGSYDIEGGFDLEKLLGIKGASAYMLAEGSWSDGISDNSVGSIFNVNGDAAGYRSLDITELWYEQMIGSESLRVRIGKLDLTGGFECRGCPVTFDGNRFANDENTQFLNLALINNPTIPFPDRGLGAVVYYNPVEWWYVSGGVGDAQADGRTTGFNTAFHGEDDYFSVFETGVVPHFDSSKGSLIGAYRLGVWYDPQEKESFKGDIKRDDNGFYFSGDQLVWKENSDTEDQQGLGVFARYGWADENVNLVKQFYSGGLSYTGLFEGRDDDVAAAGVALGRLSDEADSGDDQEVVYETFYNAQITKFLYVTPSLQYIQNPGGDDSIDDAVVIALRAQIIF